MLAEFSARAVATEVLEHLERRRPAIVGNEEQIAVEVSHALAPIRAAYTEADLPAGYLAALEREIAETIPVRWQRAAEVFTRLEERSFGLWRGGDVVARVTYVLGGLILGGIILWAPFIPIWEKWFPFALAVGAYWLPDLQRLWHQRRYAHELGRIVAALENAQPTLDKQISVRELLAPPKE